MALLTGWVCAVPCHICLFKNMAMSGAHLIKHKCPASSGLSNLMSLLHSPNIRVGSKTAFASSMAHATTLSQYCRQVSVPGSELHAGRWRCWFRPSACRWEIFVTVHSDFQTQKRSVCLLFSQRRCRQPRCLPPPEITGPAASISFQVIMALSKLVAWVDKYHPVAHGQGFQA